jgi:hypothetical protein
MEEEFSHVRELRIRYLCFHGVRPSDHQVPLKTPRYLLQGAVLLYEAHFFAILRINSVF